MTNNRPPEPDFDALFEAIHAEKLRKEEQRRARQERFKTKALQKQRAKQAAVDAELTAARELDKKARGREITFAKDGSIRQLCTNCKVAWAGGHKCARETFLVKDLLCNDEVPGALYTGALTCTMRQGPNRNGEYACQQVHLRTGHGSLRLPSGEVYEGVWVNDQWSGQGKLTRPDGLVFTGRFVLKPPTPPTVEVVTPRPHSQLLPAIGSPPLSPFLGVRSPGREPSASLGRTYQHMMVYASFCCWHPLSVGCYL